MTKTTLNLKKRFLLAYRETDKTRTLIRNLDNRIENFKYQGKTVPSKLAMDYRVARSANERCYNKECDLRDRYMSIIARERA